MTTETWIAVCGLAVNALIFVLGALIVPSMRATQKGISDVTNELHNLQLELVGIKTVVTSVTAMNSNIHELRNSMHAIQLKLAVHGLWETKEHEA